MEETKPHRYSGRHFTSEELEAIRTRIKTVPKLNRWTLSIWVCEQFGWRKPDGGLKEMSCRVALLRMEKDGLLRLPPPQSRNVRHEARRRGIGCKHYYNMKPFTGTQQEIGLHGKG